MAVPNGKAYVGPNYARDQKEVSMKYPLATSATQTKELDPTLQYNVLFDSAGQTDVSVYVTQDTAERINDGTAVWSAVQSLPACNGTAKFLGTLPKCTGVKITTVRTASQTDNSTIVDSLGGNRCVIRALPATDVVTAMVMADCIFTPLVAF